MKFKLLFLLSLILVFTGIFSKKNNKNKIKSKEHSTSFIEVNDVKPLVLDDLALEDRYERPNIKHRIQEDFMGNGKSEEEKYEEFKKSMKQKRPDYEFY